MENYKSLWSPDFAAAYIGGVTTATLAEWRGTGSGPRYMKVGRAIGYSKDDIDNWLRKCRQKQGYNYPVE